MKTFISQIANRSQVFKHTLLLELLHGLVTEKSQKASSRNFPFHYLETHAGKPVHILPEEGPWQAGMGEYWDKPKKETSHVKLLKYAPKGRTKLRRFPSSWSIAKQVAEDAGCSNIKMTLFDTSAEVTKEVKALEDDSINFISGDSSKELTKHLKEVDFVFVDPDYRSDKDWGNALKTAQTLIKQNIPFALFFDLADPKSKRLRKELDELPMFRYVTNEEKVGLFVSGVSTVVTSKMLDRSYILQGKTVLFKGDYMLEAEPMVS